MNDNFDDNAGDNAVEWPDFVQAESVEEVDGDLLLLTFADGFQFYTLANVFEAELLYNEIAVVHEYEQAGVSLEGARCVVDAGANVGIFTLYVKARCPQAMVYALEPIADTFAVLQRNVALHRLEDVHLFNAALGSANCAERAFTYFPNMTANSTATPATKTDFRQVLGEWRDAEQADLLLKPIARMAKVRTLSALLTDEAIGEIDLLKIDVEGDELEVLQGIDPAHRRKIRQISAEIHSDTLADQCQAWLEAAGYRITWEVGMTSTGGCSYLYAMQP